MSDFKFKFKRTYSSEDGAMLELTVRRKSDNSIYTVIASGYHNKNQLRYLAKKELPYQDKE